MGRRANLQKSDGGRVPHGLAPLTGPITTPREGRHPHGSDSTREPTPPKGGSVDPLRGSSLVRENSYSPID
jgi:hypothetical protein